MDLYRHVNGGSIRIFGPVARVLVGDLVYTGAHEGCKLVWHSRYLFITADSARYHNIF
jgi:hypothetical protein